MSSETWPQQLRRGLINLEQLNERGWLDAGAHSKELALAQNALDIRVPAEFHAGLAEGDVSLARQVIPAPAEAFIAEQELADPIGDERFSPHPGLTHRYPDRVLVKVTYQCAVYCRFCFRRHKVSHAEENLSFEALAPAYRYISENPQIKEVIFTGGDPLVLTDSKLEPHLTQVEKIPHIETIRFHTRVPTVLPERITEQLCERLGGSNKTVWIVVHANSASEFTEKSLTALKKLRRAGIALASQSVLLKGVNDSKEGLVALLRALYRAGVQPYYLHYPDLAKGTSHFRIPLEAAMALVDALQGQLPGLAIPKLTVDIPGGHGKITATANTCQKLSESCWAFRSPLTGDWVKVQYP
ncbi:KamA family radical SAM protein [bacterium]|nr:KamA family radical SAM protein [bacterium]